MPQSVKAWVPVYNPSTPTDQRVAPTPESARDSIGPEILKESTPLTLTPVRRSANTPPSRRFRMTRPGPLHLTSVTKGLRSFGGYVLGETWDPHRHHPAVPQGIKILEAAQLLSLSGDRKISS